MLVRDLMSPINCTVAVTFTLGEAAHRLASTDEAALLVNLRGEPTGVITHDDLAALAAAEPYAWDRRLCARLCQENLVSLHDHEPLADVLWRFRGETVQPLLVCDGSSPVGILYPEVVFRWCFDQDTAHESLHTLSEANTT